MCRTLDDDHILIRGRGGVVLTLGVADEIVRPIPTNNSGTRIERTAQIVELLLEQSSISLRLLVDRTAFALKNERTLRIFVLASNVWCWAASRGSATYTDVTTWVTIDSSLRNNFSGR